MSDSPPRDAPPPPPPAAPAPAAQGTFERTPLVYVLVHVLDRRLTGTLVVRKDDGATAALTLRDGAVVRVEMPGHGDCLGEEAVAAGACTEEEGLDALAVAQREGSLLGEVLVRQANVAPEMVRSLLLLQIAKRVADLVNLPPTTTYALHLGELGSAPNEPWAPLDVLLAAVRGWSDRTRVHGTIRFVAARPLRLHPQVDLSELLAQPIERKALDVLRDGEVTLETLYRTIGSGLSSLIYMLSVTRQLATGSAKGPMGRPPGATPIDVSSGAVQISPPELAAPYDLERSASAVVIAPLPQPITESFGKADTVPGIVPAVVPAVVPREGAGVPRATAAYPAPAAPPAPQRAPSPSPADPLPTAAAARTPSPLPPLPTPPMPPSRPPAPEPPAPTSAVSKSTLPSATAPPSVSAPPSRAPAPPPHPASAPPSGPAAQRPPGAAVSKSTLPSATAPPPSPPSAPSAARPPAPPPSAPAVAKPISAMAPPRAASLPANAPAPTAARPAIAAKPRPAPSGHPPREAADDTADVFKAVDTALARHDFKTAEMHVSRIASAASTRPDYAALFAWVGAHSGDDDALPEAVRALTRIVEEHPKCQPALYYRGMLLKRAGKEKAALRDFVMLLYENPTHLQALGEVRELRKKHK